METTSYTLPDGTTIAVDATAAKNAMVTTFTTADRRIVFALRSDLANVLQAPIENVRELIRPENV